jgi:hypothetical protein
MKTKLNKETRDQLLTIWKEKKIFLEGNILKVIDSSDDIELEEYLRISLERDREARRKRLEITKKVQSQNEDLLRWKQENEKINDELIESLAQAENSKHEALRAQEESEKLRREAELAKEEAESAKNTALDDLELIQKKSQFKMMGLIVKTALVIIIVVGVFVTGMYIFSLVLNRDTQVIGSTWSNIVGILLTNAFSIVGTIMGVRYASER